VLIGAGLVWELVAGKAGPRSETVPIATGGGLRPVTATSENAIVSAVQRVGPAVVNISTLYAPPRESQTERFLRQFMGIPSQPFPRAGEGSGIIIDGGNGYVLTNAHVVKGAARVRVMLQDKRTFDAHVVGSDPLSEVAVVQIKGGSLPAAVLGSAAKVPIGSWVIAIGNPFGFQNSVTVGVLSAKARQIADPSGVELQDLLQTDASINPGNSGGALVDLSGEVIGIPTAMIPQAQGMGFAVSIDTAKDVAQKLIKTGKMPWLGVMHHYLLPDEAKKLKVPGGEGTLVVRVVPGGPAAQAGMQAGDVILRAGGRAISSERSLGEIIRAHNAGDKLEVEVWRKGREVKLQVTLGAVPQEVSPGR
jgi:S1-C subfamily serine protease